MADAKRGESLGGMAHGRPVGLAAHDDGDVGTLVVQRKSPGNGRGLVQFARYRKNLGKPRIRR
jgi:hypothetical protein